MFRRKTNPTKESTSNKSLSQYGFLDVSDVTNFNDDDACEDDDDDEDLEAELLALTSGNMSKPKSKSAPKSAVNLNDLDNMIEQSLRDIPSDEDVSSGEDDPNILAELDDLQVDSPQKTRDRVKISPNESNPVTSSLLERLKMYETAEQTAKGANDSQKMRRLARGINTLKDLIKKAEQGHNIDEDEIPCAVSIAPIKSIPAVTIKTNESVSLLDTPVQPDIQPSNPPPIPPRISKHSSPPSEDASDEPSIKVKSTSNESPSSREMKSELSPKDDIDTVIQRQEEYKKAAVNAKKSGDVQLALSYVRIVKQFDSIISKVKEGATVDLSTLPPPLIAPLPNHDSSIGTKPFSAPFQRQESIKLTSSSTNSSDVPLLQPDVPSPPVVTVMKQPKTILEALEQRLVKFQEREEAAKKEDDSRKVRQNGRIVKQYQEAIRMHKAGKPISIDELPTPPGFPPIPTENDQPTSAPEVHPIKAPEPPPRAREPKSPSVIPPSIARTTDENRGKTTRIEKQLQALIERQKLFKTAALKAKQNGNIELAKDYLRKVKGIDQLIEASRSGLPVDLNSLPLAPEDMNTLETFEVIRLNDCIEGTDLDIFKKLIDDLKQQFEMCIKTRDHFKAMGDIANGNRLDELALKTKKDLKFVQLAEANNLRVPKFHYETKPFTIVQCNTDLTDNEVEVVLVQGISYNVPNPTEVDTYIKLYFPYPTETPQQFKSSIVYNTNNPTYDLATKFNIQRNARACQRIFKRQTLKCEIFSKGGFLRSDTLIGTVNVKLQPLETHCTIHDAYDLMDGRRPVGGKLEVKVKVRDPILTKEIVRVEEKWLVIDS